MTESLCAAVLVTLLASPVLPREAPSRAMVAIANVEVAPGGWTVPPPQLGETIAQLLLDQLVASAEFHVLDGQWLVPEDEIGRPASTSRLREAAASRGVDYLILGHVTAFSTERSRRSGGGLLPIRAFLLGGVTRQRVVTTVGVSFRIVDVRTGEIVATATGEGVGARKNVNVGGLGVVRGISVGALAARTFQYPRDAMLDEALHRAVETASRGLISAAPRLEAHRAGER